MDEIRAPRPRLACCARRRSAGRPSSASASACRCSSRRARSTDGTRAWACSPAGCAASRGRCPCPTWAGTGSPCRSRIPLFDGLAPGEPRLLRALLLLRRAGRRDPRHLRLRPRFPGGGGPGQRARRAVPSREEPGRGPAHARRTSCAWMVRRRRAEDRVIVVPAIDIRKGRVVRLKQGRLEDETVYGAAPADGGAALGSRRARARIHLVDLDAALESRPQREVVAEVIAAVKIPVEVGGGLRVLENAAALSRERRRPGDLRHRGGGPAREWCRRRCGCGPRRWRWRSTPRTARWRWRAGTRSRPWPPSTSRRPWRRWGVRRIQYTDVVRDGTLRGPEPARHRGDRPHERAAHQRGGRRLDPRGPAAAARARGAGRGRGHRGQGPLREALHPRRSARRRPA